MLKDNKKAESMIRRDILAIKNNVAQLDQEAQQLHQRLAQIDQIRKQLSDSVAEWEAVLGPDKQPKE